MSKFPACFPKNFETDILPKEAKFKYKSVYRVIKSGTINREGFISTHEEIERGLIPPKKRLSPQDPGRYSTSCNIEYEDAEYMLNVFMRHHPRPVIAKGTTEITCGPCQLTSERDVNRKDSHVDWWVYEDADPQEYFREVEKSAE